METSTEPEFDNTQADGEGWAIFATFGSADGRWQLQRCDEADVFSSDHEAWLHVLRKALVGSAYHQGALDFIRRHNPGSAASWAGFANLCGLAVPCQLSGAAPFMTPITRDKSVLVAADAELICDTESATDEELNFLVAAVNHYAEYLKKEGPKA